MENFEAVMSEMLSMNPARIRRVWRDLTDAECLTVLDHLRRITLEPYWSEAQRRAARLALETVRDEPE